jgi:adenosine deaminase
MRMPIDSPAPGRPLIDLHCHLEGSLNPVVSFDLLLRRGRCKPDERSGFVHRARYFAPAYRAFKQAMHLLESCMTDREAVIEAVADVVVRAANQGVRIFEPSFAPSEFKNTAPCGSLEPFTEAVIAGIEQGRRGRDIEVGLRALIISRHQSISFRAKYCEVYDHIIAYREHFVGADVCGLDFATKAYQALYGEQGYPWNMRWVRNCCDRLRGAGLRLTAHAGEFASSEAMYWAVDLGVERIGHGIQAVHDPEIIEVLKERGIALEICPTSNVRLGAVAGEVHPIGRLMRAGLNVTINTDDPGVQGNDWSSEFNDAQRIHGLSNAEISACLANAYEASFLTAAQICRFQPLFCS